MRIEKYDENISYELISISFFNVHSSLIKIHRNFFKSILRFSFHIFDCSERERDKKRILLYFILLIADEIHKSFKVTRAIKEWKHPTKCLIEKYLFIFTRRRKPISFIIFIESFENENYKNAQ